MIEMYQLYLEEKLKESGVKEKICKTMKELQNFQGSHVGAVIVDFDKLDKHKKNKVYEVGEKKIKRVKKFDRITRLNIIIGDQEIYKCDAIFATFLSKIDRGIVDPDGNFVEIELEQADWISDKDSILKSKIAVQLPINFHGGIYKDYVYADVVPYILLDDRKDNE